MAGRRLPAAWAAVRRTVDTLRASLVTAPLAEPCLQGTAWLAEFVSAVNMAVSRLAFKMAWLDRLPYKLARAREPSIAADCLAVYDAAVVAHVGPVDPVSDEFLAANGALREAFERHTAGLGLSAA